MKKLLILFSILLLVPNIFAQNKMGIWQKGVRGVNVQSDISYESLKYLRDNWGANVIRVMCYSSPLLEKKMPFNLIEYNWRNLDTVCSYAKRIGLYVIIDPHTFPGIYSNNTKQAKIFWNSGSYQKLFVAMWDSIVTRYKNEKEVIGYDIFSEARPGDRYISDYDSLTILIIKKIRDIDNKTPIIIAPPSYGKKFQDINHLSYLKAYRNIVISPHYYEPFNYTHQGQKGRKEGLVYPNLRDKLYISGIWRTVKVTSNEIEKSLLSYKKFQDKYNIPIYIGEFNTLRYVPGGDIWVHDVISIFNRFGWSWTYHAYREYQGNNPELGTNKGNRKKKSNTERVRILKNGFKLNNKNYLKISN